MNEIILDMENISKSFSSVKVLDDVSLKIKRGEIHALVGGNGAGKSTLMKILTGIYSCDEGTIIIDGEKIDLKDEDNTEKYGIRMIFQELSLIPSMTVAENIFLNQRSSQKGLDIVNKRDIEKRAKELLNMFEIHVDPGAVVSSLGAGYCQLIEIVKALSRQAKILVMDEPTASLTEYETMLLFKIMRKLKEQGVTIIYISHRMNEILQIADAVTVLRDGKHVVTADSKGLTIQSIINYIIGENAKNSFSRIERNYTGDNSPMVEIKALTIDDRIRDIEFSVNKGEILGFAGLMGSGRTEIVEAIFGVVPPRHCEISMEGKKIKIHSVQQAINAGIVLIPENRRTKGLVLKHSVKDNILLPLLKQMKKANVLDERKIKTTVNESIKELNIKTDNMDKISALLSGGNQQKIVIAKWLRTNPKLLIMDEPTAGIDIGAKGEIVEVVRRFADTGNSVIIISSELSELVAVCDRILILRDGKILGEMNKDEIISEEALQHAIQQ